MLAMFCFEMIFQGGSPGTVKLILPFQSRISYLQLHKIIFLVDHSISDFHVF